MRIAGASHGSAGSVEHLNRCAIVLNHDSTLRAVGAESLGSHSVIHATAGSGNCITHEVEVGSRHEIGKQIVAVGEEKHIGSGVAYGIKHHIGCIRAIDSSLHCNLYFFENKVELGGMYVVLISSIAVLMGVYIAMTQLSKRRK